MKENNVICEKTEDFAIRILKLGDYLQEKKQYIIANQIVRAGTSVGANVAESQCAVSPKDFLNKLYISFKEVSETMYWLRLLVRSEILTTTEFESIYNDAREIQALLNKITRTTTDRINSGAL